MSSQPHTGLERLSGYKILPTPEGFDEYTVFLQIGSREVAFVADHQSLRNLAASIQTNVTPPKSLIG
jgi:hypothetical protein